MKCSLFIALRWVKPGECIVWLTPGGNEVLIASWIVGDPSPIAEPITIHDCNLNEMMVEIRDIPLPNLCPIAPSEKELKDALQYIRDFFMLLANNRRTDL